MKAISFLTLAGHVSSAQALIGFGISMYDPNCAFACRAAIAGATLACTQHDHHGGGHHGSGATTPQCYSEDTSFLTTLAWCISDRCEDIEDWRLERYWYLKAAASSDERVLPKWTYQQSLEEVPETPTEYINASDLLDFTGLVSEVDYEANRGALNHFEWQEALHSRNGIIVLVVGIGIPIVTTLLAYLPCYTYLSKLKVYLVYPPLIRTYHVVPLPYLLGNVPTLGQTAYIVIFLLLNVFLTALDYKSFQPSAWFQDSKAEILVYLANRTGVIAFALAPLVILFSGRNNILLWLTNWSHSTYLLLHRWVARIFTLQVLLHSIIELELYTYQGGYEEELVQEYWIWGCVATVACSIMMVTSLLWFRRAAYEVFLVLHIILAAFVIIGSWYHIEFLFQREWGYQYWLYAACAVWFFDRVARAAWIVRNGILKAEMTPIDESVVRIDISGVRWGFTPGQHAYIYFPGAKRWTFWEAHPFSVIPILRPTETVSFLDLAESGIQTPISEASDNSELVSTDPEKRAGVTSRALVERIPSKEVVLGIRFYIRKHSGITRAFSHTIAPTVLLEGPYYNHNQSFKPSVTTCDRIILLAGGIGITAVLGYIHAHPNTKLFWSAKASSKALVDDIQRSGLLTRLGHDAVLNIAGPRLNFTDVLMEEAEVMRTQSTSRTRVGVVVCGPSSFCDDARAAVVTVGRKGLVEFELCEEAFSW